MVGAARRNFLSIWTAKSFSRPLDYINVLRRQVVICNNPRFVQEAFVKKHANFQRKTPQMRMALQPLLGDGLFVSDQEVWQRRRKIVAPIIHTSRLRDFAPVMIETACEKRAEWRGRGDGAAIDALAEMAHLTAEIICRTIFGRDLGQTYAAEIVEAFSDYQRHVDQIDLPSMLGLPEWLPRWRGRAVKRSVRRIHAVLDEIIDGYAARQSNGESSVIGGLLDARDDDGKPLGKDAIRNEAAVIFMAGHETTANTMAWAWFLLSQAPWAANRLHTELDTVLGGRVPRLDDVPQFPYTRAIIEETLRLYPPVPILGREAMAADRFGNTEVRKGALVLVVPWLLHRNPTLWSKPDHFMPERFLPGGDGANQSKYGYVPFSIGPRICAGLAFGLNEAILCLAVLAQEFALDLAPGKVVEPVCRLTLRPGDRLPMTLHPRKP
ncbi:cytochrome P450 [Breoghania sp. L-A4]|nr:cytochrome P450 [Breoghania sp. L-A4]